MHFDTILIALIGAGGTIISALLLRGQGRIHTLVNSHLKAMTDKVAELTQEISDLKDEILELKLEREQRRSEGGA